MIAEQVFSVKTRSDSTPHLRHIIPRQKHNIGARLDRKDLLGNHQEPAHHYHYKVNIQEK